MNTTLVNAQPFEVLRSDGTRETVEVRQLSIRQLYKFAEHVSADNTPEIIALCTGKPAAWVDELDIASYGELVKKAYALNFQRAVELLKKDAVVAARLLPLLHRMHQAMELAGSIGEPSSAPSPAPATSESAAATGSAAST